MDAAILHWKVNFPAMNFPYLQKTQGSLDMFCSINKHERNGTTPAHPIYLVNMLLVTQQDALWYETDKETDFEERWLYPPNVNITHPIPITGYNSILTREISCPEKAHRVYTETQNNTNIRDIYWFDERNKSLVMMSRVPIKFTRCQQHTVAWPNMGIISLGLFSGRVVTLCKLLFWHNQATSAIQKSNVHGLWRI